MHGGRPHRSQDPGVQTGVLLQRGAPRGRGGAAQEWRRRLQDATQRRRHERLSVGQRSQAADQHLQTVRLGRRRRRGVDVQVRRGLGGPVHLLAPDVGHRGAAAGHRLAQRGVLQGGDPSGRAHTPAQRERTSHQGGGAEAHPGGHQGEEDRAGHTGGRERATE